VVDYGPVLGLQLVQGARLEHLPALHVDPAGLLELALEAPPALLVGLEKALLAVEQVAALARLHVEQVDLEVADGSVEVHGTHLVLEVYPGDPVRFVGNDGGKQQDQRQQQREAQVQAAPDRAQSVPASRPGTVARGPPAGKHRPPKL
jgi:hypothetical protein